MYEVPELNDSVQIIEVGNPIQTPSLIPQPVKGRKTRTSSGNREPDLNDICNNEVFKHFSESKKLRKHWESLMKITEKGVNERHCSF